MQFTLLLLLPPLHTRKQERGVYTRGGHTQGVRRIQAHRDTGQVSSGIYFAIPRSVSMEDFQGVSHGS